MNLVKTRFKGALLTALLVFVAVIISTSLWQWQTSRRVTFAYGGATAIIRWTFAMYASTPEPKMSFPTKEACEKAAAEWRVNLKEGTGDASAKCVPRRFCCEGEEHWRWQ